MIKFRKTIQLVLITGVFFTVGPSFSAENDVIRNRYNEMIETIANDIMEAKYGYPELEGFSKSAISVAPNGFESIFYMHESSAGSHDPYAYSFSVGIRDLNSPDASVGGSSWEVKFPLLGFKVVVESQAKGEAVSFDLKKIFESNLESLRVLEQDYLPFRLELQPQKEVYSVREDIAIIASLKNAGIQAFKVSDLDQSSLYCKIGDKEWGNPESVVELNKVLNSYGTIKKILRIYGFEDPQELWVTCTYAIGYKGVRPYSRIKIPIQPKR